MKTLALFSACTILLITNYSLAQDSDISLDAPQNSVYQLTLTSQQLKNLNHALENYHDNYNPAEQMLRSEFSSPGYHTTLKGGTVHRTRRSTMYAAALLDTDNPEYHQRAEKILHKVISLQDQDPDSRTYGIWSWFLEEPLEEMSPPDWNWADFIGTQLIQVALYHREDIPEDLLNQVDEAIYHAAQSIQKRNVGPGYTNIAIMGTYVTMVTAELYELPELRDYAMQRLKRFHEYTFDNGAFSEYNSPTYTSVALRELDRMRQHIMDPGAQKLIRDLYSLAWEEIALHFHPPTWQWAGPHSRSYRTILPQSSLYFIQRASDERIDFDVYEPGLEDHRLPLTLPEKFYPHFTSLTENREIERTFIASDQPVVGTTYLTPDYTIGSINLSDMWNQRRPLVAYWGSPDETHAVRVRFLHDGYDFSSAYIFTDQSEGRILAGINFVTDGGDTHISLDKVQNATISAEDLRLRFEFEGVESGTVTRYPKTNDKLFSAQNEKIHITAHTLYKKFGNFEIRSGAEEEQAADLILYQGSRRNFNLADIAESGIILLIVVESEDHGRFDAPGANVEVRDDRIIATWEDLKIQMPGRPVTIRESKQIYHGN